MSFTHNTSALLPISCEYFDFMHTHSISSLPCTYFLFYIPTLHNQLFIPHFTYPKVFWLFLSSQVFCIFFLPPVFPQNHPYNSYIVLIIASIKKPTRLCLLIAKFTTLISFARFDHLIFHITMMLVYIK